MQTIGEYFLEFSKNGQYEIFQQKHKLLSELITKCDEASSISAKDLKNLEELVSDYGKFISTLPAVGGILAYDDFLTYYSRMKITSADFDQMDQWNDALEFMIFYLNQIYNYIALMTGCDD